MPLERPPLSLALLEQEAENFWSKVAIGDPATCWLWQARYCGRYKHGMYTTSRKRGRHHVNAHRMAFMLEYGVILPTSLLVLHRCDNPPCCNPNHSFLGEHQDNSSDMVMKKRQLFGEKHNRCKLTEDQVREIKRKSALGVSVVHLASDFNISVQAIYDIRQGRRWKHVA